MNDPHQIAAEAVCCAHIKVKYVRINHEGGTCSDSWQCADCGHAFIPKAWHEAAIEKATKQIRKQMDFLAKDMAESRAERDHYKMLTQELGQELCAAHMSEEKCLKCGKPVGNTVFTYCDDCWESAHVSERTDLLELAWGIIANASGGDWDKESKEWRDAATRWRDSYFGSSSQVSKASSEMPNANEPPHEPAYASNPMKQAMDSVPFGDEQEADQYQAAHASEPLNDLGKILSESFWDEKYVDERLGRDASWPQIIEAANYSIQAAIEKAVKDEVWNHEQTAKLLHKKVEEFQKSRAAEAIELLRSVHNWFMKSAPEHYNGCGLWIDVDAFLKETESRQAAHASGHHEI